MGGSGFNPLDPVGSVAGIYNSGDGGGFLPTPIESPVSNQTMLNTLTGGATNAFGLTKDTSDLADYVGYLNPMSPAEQGIGHLIKGGDVWEALDRAVDLPGSRMVMRNGKLVPQGDVDRGTREVGKWANDISGGASGQAMSVAAPIIGGIVGGIVTAPAGGAGAMIGAPIGKVFADKWNQKSYEQTAKDYAIAQTIAAATYGVGQGIDALSAPVAGDALGGGITDPEMLKLATEGGFMGSGAADQAAAAAASAGGGVESGLGYGGQIDTPTSVVDSIPGAIAPSGGGAAGPGGVVESGLGYGGQIDTPTSVVDSIPGAIAPSGGGGIVKQLANPIIGTATRGVANQAWPIEQKQPAWTQEAINRYMQGAQETPMQAPVNMTALDPEMGRTITPSRSGEANMLKSLFRVGSDTGSMSNYRMLNRLRRA